MNNTEKKYYFGGYYLTKLKPKNYGEDKNGFIYTCSECINDHILDVWSYSWTSDNNEQLDEIKKNYFLTDQQIDEIRNWVDNKFNDNKIGFLNVFTDLATAIEYKNRFFSRLDDIKIFALYFDTNERADILEEFKPQSEKMGDIGLRLTLLKEIEENENEVFIGFDYIGIEFGGSFHTFHCHDIGKELSEKFGLTLNNLGLFESDINSKQVLEYLNNEENGCETVPWFIVKTKLVTNK
ncbi:MAG TPA: hypothetical protein PLZ32_11315 [Saprospiraceae bacterium]|nr:hypothetical protein [Saprospiraceae bacterium]